MNTDPWAAAPLLDPNPNEDGPVERRRRLSERERIVNGIIGSADDLDQFGELALPAVAARLRRIAAAVENLDARGLIGGFSL